MKKKKNGLLTEYLQVLMKLQVVIRQEEAAG